jgi:hypothetical protein
MVCPPATSEAEARWPRFGLVVDATTSRRDNKDQMIRPLISYLKKNMKHKKLIEIPPYYIDTFGPASIRRLV